MQMSKIIIGTLRPPLATNATAGIIKGGDDITIGTGGEPVVNTNYDTVDVNTAANIQNIVKGMKFKSILGNIVSALMGLNGDISKINSDLFKNNGQSTNPNNITKSGLYYMTSNTTNAPTTAGFLLLHFEADSRISQIAIVNGVSNNYYIRTKPSGSGTAYSAWRRLLTDDDFIYKAGDKISVNGTWVNGTLTSANKYIYIEIPTRKPISGSISFIPTALSVRQSGTYLAETVSSFNEYNFDIVKVGDIGVRIRIERTGNWGGTNNDTVAVALDGNIIIS